MSRPTLAGMDGSLRIGIGSNLLAQDAPSHVRAQFLAANFACRRAFNLGAALRRHSALDPVDQALDRNAQEPGKLGCPAGVIDGPLKC